MRLQSLRERAGRVWTRHRTLFWMVHSAWALVAGIAIVLLARERYHLVLWVGLALALTWALTLFFGRAAAVEPGQPPSLGHELTSYLTRVLYQETLFFLIPFYASSTVIGSPNVLFLALLVGLAAFSCVDLYFDRLLRSRPVFAIAFFAMVAFAAINLLLPIATALQLRFAVPAAALLSVISVVPLVLRTEGTWRARLRLLAAVVVLAAIAVGLPGLIPPVPLRLERTTFASGIERTTLALADALADRVSSAEVGSSLVVLVEVFAPSALPTSVRLEWRRDGDLVRVSRDVSITAHAAGFRVWDAWRVPSGSVPPGRYRVVLQTTGRVFGVADVTVGE